MAQQTRKDPRARVLSMTVRYKSATLDEFIEHHSHDVSRGGMFIKTPQPFPPGTLLKFEVRIAEDQKVMQGVGRVVWKRDGTSADPERPAGMGVKYIKLDDESRRLIDQLLSTRVEETSAFETEGEADIEGEAQVGLGLSGMASPREGGGQSSTSFFPKTEPAVLPLPEDRTVMKQAAELLEEALREVSSDASDDNSGDTERQPQSLAPAGDELEVTKPGRPPAESSLGRLPTPKVPVVTRESAKAPAKTAEQVAGELVASAKAAASVRPDKEATPSVRPSSDQGAAKSTGTRSSRPSLGLPTLPATPKPLRAERRAFDTKHSKPAAAVPTPKEPGKESAGRAIFWILAVAASVGAIYWLTRPTTVPPPAPDVPSVQANVAPAETPREQAVPTAPVVTDEPAAVPSVAAATSEAPSAASLTTPSTVAPTTTAPPVAPAVPAVAKVKAKAAAPKAEVASTPAPTEATDTQPAETKPAETKPAETKPAETPAEAPASTAAVPKKAAAPAESDNPY